MKHLFTLLLSCLALVAFVYFTYPDTTSTVAIENDAYKKLPKRDRMDLAMAQEVEMTKDPSLGIVPRERLMKARAQAMAQQQQSLAFKGTALGPMWTERGPVNVAGRTRAIMMNANDTARKSAFAAGVAGGLWKTDNIFKSQPNWAPIDDFFSNLAITCLTTQTSNPLNIYFGTGEGYFNGDAVRGDGIWKSTDGGSTFAQLTSTAGADEFEYVQQMKVHPITGDVFAATRDGQFGNVGGIMRSTDGGATWTKVLNTTSSGFTWAADIEILTNGNLLAAIGIGFTDGIYLSQDNGSTWTQTLAATAGEQRIDLAVAPSNPLVAYALIEGAGNAISRIVKTVNGGLNWSNATLPTWDDCGQGTTPADFTRGQAFYNLAMAVDPNNANVLMVGGIDLFKSLDGGSSWTQISNWREGCSTYQYVHADQHQIMYPGTSSDTVLFGNDGGIYLSLNGSDTVPTIRTRGTNFRTAQYYSCSLDPAPRGHNFIGGTQDNGSHRFNSVGLNSVVEVSGGDGAYSAIDQDEPAFQFTTFTNNNYNRSTDGGLSFNFVLANNSGRFINPFDYDNQDDKIYASTNPGQYLLWSDPQSGNTISAIVVSEFGGGQVSATRCSDSVAERVYFGTGNGKVVRVDNAATAPVATDLTSASFPSGYVSCIEVYSRNEDYMLVTFSNYGVTSVFYSTNGGTSWSEVEGDLPDMPVRWALFNPKDSTQALLATELGVWSTDNLQDAIVDWEPSNNGLANVRTDMLQYRASDGLVLAATHGRGMFSSDLFSDPLADFDADREIAWVGDSIQFIDGSLQATSWEWNFGDGTSSNLQNPVHPYFTEGIYTVTLIINGGADTLVKANFMTVLPNRGTPYEITDGGNFETNVFDFGTAAIEGGYTPWQRGVPGNELTFVNSSPNVWKTLLASDLPNRTYKAGFYTPSFNLSTDPGTYVLRCQTSMEVVFCNLPYGVQVQYTLDRGRSWTRLGNTNDPDGVNWYNRSPSQGCALDAGLFTDQTGWTFNASNRATNYDVSSLAGNSDVIFRFVIASVAGLADSTYRDGFMIDDFSMAGTNNAAIPAAGSSDPTPLPVTLLDFQVGLAGNAVAVKWSTSAEKDNDYFEIERSLDGKEFSSVGQVDGKGTTKLRNNYDFMDRNVEKGMNYYYRLADVSFAGERAYSEVKRVYVPKSDVDIFTLFPNPTNDVITISYATNGEMTLRTAQGQAVHITQISASTKALSLKRLGLANGLYFMTFIAEDGRRATKRIILKN